MAWFANIMLIIQPLACDIDVEVIQTVAGDNSFRRPNNKSQPQNGMENDHAHPQTFLVGPNDSRSNQPDSEDQSDRSVPVSIPRSEHWRAPKASELIPRATPVAPVEYLPDGTRIEFKMNEFQEYMPTLPEIARPQNTMRQNTRPSGTCRWNPITGCWIDIDYNTSRGTWGCFKDRTKLIRRPEDCEPGDLGLFAVETISEGLGAVAITQIGSLIVHDTILHTSPHNTILTNIKREIQPEASANFLTLDQLRELVRENEDAVESYAPSIGEHIVRRRRQACGPGGCP